MDNILIFTDLHLTKKDLDEGKLILEEISSLIVEHKVTRLMIAGDTFDGLSPSSEELDLFASFLKQFSFPIVILAAKSHESENLQTTILTHFGLLKENIAVVPYWEDGYLYVGHFIVSEAKKCYGGTVSKKTLEKYKYTVLGHSHHLELIPPNICQLGSCRFVNFDEGEQKEKVVLLIQDYKGEGEKVVFLPLKSPFPMVSLEIGQIEPKQENEAVAKDLPHKLTLVEAISQLNCLNPKTKVRLEFYDYPSYREWLGVKSNYDNKFQQIKTEKRFNLVNQIEVGKKNEIITFQKSFEEWLNKQTIDPEIKKILLEKE